MQMNMKHSIIPLVTLCNASSCSCVPGCLWNTAFHVFILLLFGLWRPTLSFWRHVVLVWRALKALNRSLWTLTGQCEYNSYASLNYISSIRRWTELGRPSQRNSLLCTTIGQNGYWIWMSILNHLKQFYCPDTNISCKKPFRASLSLVFACYFCLIVYVNINPFVSVMYGYELWLKIKEQILFLSLSIFFWPILTTY